MPLHRQPHPDGHGFRPLPLDRLPDWHTRLLHRAVPPAATDDVPVTYEECICPCHSTPDPPMPVKVMA